MSRRTSLALDRFAGTPLWVDRREDRVGRRLQDGASYSDDAQAAWDALTADYGAL